MDIKGLSDYVVVPRPVLSQHLQAAGAAAVVPIPPPPPSRSPDVLPAGKPTDGGAPILKPAATATADCISASPRVVPLCPIDGPYALSEIFEGVQPALAQRIIAKLIAAAGLDYCTRAAAAAERPAAERAAARAAAAAAAAKLTEPVSGDGRGAAAGAAAAGSGRSSGLPARSLEGREGHYALARKFLQQDVSLSLNGVAVTSPPYAWLAWGAPNRISFGNIPVFTGSGQPFPWQRQKTQIKLGLVHMKMRLYPVHYTNPSSTWPPVVSSSYYMPFVRIVIFRDKMAALSLFQVPGTTDRLVEVIGAGTAGQSLQCLFQSSIDPASGPIAQESYDLMLLNSMSCPMRYDVLYDKTITMSHEASGGLILNDAQTQLAQTVQAYKEHEIKLDLDTICSYPTGNVLAPYDQNVHMVMFSTGSATSGVASRLGVSTALTLKQYWTEQEPSVNAN